MRNSIKVKVLGSSPYSINILIKKGIKIKNPLFFDKYIVFTIDYKDKNICKEILDQQNRKFDFFEQKGFRKTYSKSKLHLGLVFGMIISIILILLYSFSLLKIEIRGNDLVSEKEILEVINENIKLPSFEKHINKEKLEKSINSLDGISSVNIQRKGTTIVIDILEELPKTNIEDIKLSYQPLVSKYDCIITRIVPTSGTSLIKKGDTVRKGQELIVPFVEIDEETRIMTKAGGEVYGRVWFCKKEVFYPQKTIYKRTGKKTVFYEIKGFDWIKNKKITFENYEIEYEEIILNSICPLKMKKYTYYETKEETVYYDFFSEKDIIIKELKNQLEEELPEDGEKIRYWYNIKTLDKIVFLDIYYEVEMLIV